MRRLNAWNWFLVLLTALLMVCTGGSAWAQAIDFSKPYARMNAYVLGAGGAAAGCAVGSQIGTSSTQSDTWDVGTGNQWCYQATANCTGTLDKGYIYKSGTGSGQVGKVAIYNSAGDTLIDYSEEITGVNNDWNAGAAMVTGASVTNTTTYYICVCTGPSAGWRISRGTSAGVKYGSGVGYPPASVPGNNYSASPIAVYVTIK